MKKIILGICILIIGLVGCSTNGQEEKKIEGDTTINDTSILEIGAAEYNKFGIFKQKVLEDMHCNCKGEYCWCVADRILVELDKGVYALNLSYYRKANTSWKDNATKIT